MLNDFIVMSVFTLLPFLELRVSIPYGILLGYPWWVVFVVCIAIVMILLLIQVWYNRIVNKQ